MTSPSHVTRRPIRQITLKAKVEGAGFELASVQSRLTGVKISGKVLLRSVETADPEKAIEELLTLGDAIKAAEKIRKA